MARLRTTMLALTTVGLLATACSSSSGSGANGATSSTGSSSSAPAAASAAATSSAAASAPGRSTASAAGSAAPAASGSAAPASAPSTAGLPKLNGVSLTIWAAQNSNQTAKKAADSFDAATGAKIKIVTVPDPYEQGVQTKVAAGNKPDMAFWQPTASELTGLNAKNNLLPLNDEPFVGQYAASFKNVTGILDGTRYAALVSVPAVEGVWYNKQVFAKYGITSTPKNFAEMIADAQKIKAAGGVPFYEMGGDRWATQWWVQVLLADAAKQGLWSQVNAGKAKFTDPTILGAIQKYKSLVDQGLFNKNITSATFVDQGKAILSGQAAMAIQVNTFFSELQASSSTAELNQKIGFFPISPSGNVGTFIPDQSNALVLFKTGDDKRQNAAKAFINYWLGAYYPTFIKDLNTVSIETGVTTPSTVPQALQANADSIGNSVGSMQVSAIVNPDLYINLANMLAGKMSPQQVASTTQDQFAQLAQAIGAPGF